MATKGVNRYAMFEENDPPPPRVKSTVDISYNPFINQVGENPAPWQEVKKRGVASAAPHPPVPIKQSVFHTLRRASIAPDLRLRNRSMSNSTADTTARLVSATSEASDKAFDPHENWCGVCNQKFANKQNLLSHIKQATLDHKHYCNLCKRVFKDRNGLKNHLENSSGHDVFCNLCLSAFNDEWGLKCHFETSNNGHEFVCVPCLLAFRSRVQLDRHFQTSEKHTWCKPCSRRFRNQDERDEHWAKTNKHKHCMEPGCDFDGPSQAELDKHLSRDHFRCIGCKLIFQSQNKLSQHVETCRFAIPCHQCGHMCASQADYAAHLEHCFYCGVCDFATHHRGNYDIHMTKHATATIPCWACATPLRTYSSLLNHLESSRCPNFTHPARLTACLGKWWYSALYMDLDLHAHIRTGRINVEQMVQWMNDGSLHPFVCRAMGCQKTFGHLSSLVLHCESKACGWDIARLNMPGLEKEFKMICDRRDRGIA